MYHLHARNKQSGLLLVELIVVTAISVIIFGALFVSFQFTLELIATTRSKLSALSLANDRMEYFRSLAYDEVGVIAGFPAGTIAQNSTLSLNDVDFQERVRVDYVDDPADDIAGVDGNSIVTDYKQIRLEYTWEVNGNPKELALTSFIVPRSIETDVGGGTARIVVLDADSTFLPDAIVRMFSSSSTFTYDRTIPSDANGSALFAVPADSGYQVEVTANIAGQQYSTSSTYVPTTSNPNPVVGPFAVLEADVSTLTFQIGELSDMNIAVTSDITEDSAYEPFDDVSGVASSSAINVTGGDLALDETLGVYEPSGVVYLVPVIPSVLDRWEVIRVVAGVPLDTSYAVQLYTGDATTAYTLIPDSELSGNSTGFTDTLIDISELDAVTYPSVTIGVSLLTTDTTITPAVDEVEVYWRESSIDRTGFSMDIRGDKLIGTESDGSAIYKSTTTVSTDGSGEVSLAGMEFDTYRISPATSVDLATACQAYPITHQAGVDSDVELLYVPDASHTLRVSAVDGLGRALPGVSVQLERSGYDVTQLTNTCGQTFFTGSLSDNSDYELTISAPGYTTQTLDPFTVSGDTTTGVILLP